MERKHVKADVGVVVGRFQVDELHPGHKELLDWVFSQHSKVIVVLGLPAVFGMRANPLDYEARAAMIKESYPKAITAFVTDCRGDREWSWNLDGTLSSLVSPGQSLVLYGSRNSFISHYEGSFPTQELVGEGDFWSGTEVREKIRVEGVSQSAAFRAGVIWGSMNRYPTVYATVDVAIMRTLPEVPNVREILLARKSNDPAGKWRFIGGFADPKSKCFEEDARREVMEETGVEVGTPEYVGSRNIADWRYRGEEDVIRSTLFRAEYVFGAAKANDDIQDVKWWRMDSLDDSFIVPEHRDFFKMLQEREKLVKLI